MTDTDAQIRNTLKEASDGLSTIAIAKTINKPRSTVFENLQALEESGEVKSHKPHSRKRVWEASNDTDESQPDRHEGIQFLQQRQSVGITQKELAQRTGFSESYISRWENADVELKESKRDVLWRALEHLELGEMSVDSNQGDVSIEEVTSVYVAFGEENPDVASVEIPIPESVTRDSYIRGYVAGEKKSRG